MKTAKPKAKARQPRKKAVWAGTRKKLGVSHLQMTLPGLGAGVL